MRARATQLRYEISAKEQDNRELRGVIRPLREADPEAIERIAREKLYMVRPDDILYILPPEFRPVPPVLNEPGSPTAPPVPSKRWAGQWHALASSGGASSLPIAPI